MKTIAVIGGRDFNNYKLLKERVLFYIQNIQEEVRFVSGGAKGADSLIEKFCEEFDYEIIVHPAKWEEHGRAAGFIRNKLIIDDDADMCIAFWDGVSRGTQHSVNMAHKKGIPVRIVSY